MDDMHRTRLLMARNPHEHLRTHQNAACQYSAFEFSRFGTDQCTWALSGPWHIEREEYGPASWTAPTPVQDRPSGPHHRRMPSRLQGKPRAPGAYRIPVQTALYRRRRAAMQIRGGSAGSARRHTGDFLCTELLLHPECLCLVCLY